MKAEDRICDWEGKVAGDPQSGTANRKGKSPQNEASLKGPLVQQGRTEGRRVKAVFSKPRGRAPRAAYPARTPVSRVQPLGLGGDTLLLFTPTRLRALLPRQKPTEAVRSPFGAACHTLLRAPGCTCA